MVTIGSALRGVLGDSRHEVTLFGPVVMVRYLGIDSIAPKQVIIIEVLPEAGGLQL